MKHAQDKRSAIGRRGMPHLLCLLVLAAGLLASGNPAPAAVPDATKTPPVNSSIPDWVHDALVVAMPAAAVGGCQSGIYTPAENGVRPWRQALIRWLTSRHVRGNAAVLVRQEGPRGGAELAAIVDPNADYLLEVSVHLPGKGSFGEVQDDGLQVWISVLDADDRVLAEAPVPLVPSDWAPGQVSFASGARREVRCVVQAKSPGRLPCFYFAEGFRLTRKDHAWWNPQNVFHASRTAVRLGDQRGLLVQTLDPDVVAGHNGVYLNWDGFFTRRGIAVGGGHWEQEYNHLAIDDPLVDQFRDDGMARELDGKSIGASRLWPGYHMCHNAPGWHSHYKRQVTRIAPEVQLLSQDNIGAPSFMHWGKGCFCRACREGFRDWLRRRWTAEQFYAVGIGDPAALDIVDYVNKVGATRIAKGRDAVLADPVLRAYIQFHYAAQADRWRDAVAAVKKAAGHPIAVCGNQWGADGKWPSSVTLSQISDVTFTETGAGGGTPTPQKRAWNVLAAKIGLAAGEYGRPVWLCMSSLMNAPQAARSQLRMIGAQAWADGALPMPWATAAGASGWFYDSEARLCRFVQQHRPLFARRERYANVGLVYSLPTHAWRQFKSFGLLSTTQQQWFVAWARLLEESHVPYEVNCWWHPLLGDDRVSLERLKRYRVLVLPGVDCFTDAQREAVRAFQARGGLVISVACPTWCDGDAVPRPAGDALAAEGDRLIQVTPAELAKYAAAANRLPEKADETQAAARPLKESLRRALADDKLIETDAPADVWANLWLDDTRHVLALHLVNGDMDIAADRFRPVESSRWRVRLPAGMAVTRAVSVSPDETHQSSPPKPLAVEVSGGWATVVVPRLESYCIVALFAGDALSAATDLAAARRAIWRTSLIRGQGDAASQSRLNDTLSLLRAGRYDAGTPAARQASRDSASVLAGLLRDGNTQDK